MTRAVVLSDGRVLWVPLAQGTTERPPEGQRREAALKIGMGLGACGRGELKAETRGNNGRNGERRRAFFKRTMARRRRHRGKAELKEV